MKSLTFFDCLVITLIAVACLIAVAVVLSFQSADANLAPDEVARYGSIGTSTLQDIHEHPHDRTIWYEEESATYHGVHSDSIDEDTGQSLTEPITIPDNVPELDFEGLVFHLKSGNDIRQTVICPDNFSLDVIVHSAGRDVPNYYEEYTKDIDPWYLTINFREPGHDTNWHKKNIEVIHWELLDDSFYMLGIAQTIPQDPYPICSNNESKVFLMDIWGQCDGSGIEFISRDPAGYNLTVIGEHIDHILCIT